MITDFFNSTAVIKQRQNTKNEISGIAVTYTDRIASLTCRITAVRSRVDDGYGRINIVNTLRMFCDANSDTLAIEECDRITVGSKTYEITGIVNPGLLDRHLEIDLSEVR